MRARVRYRVVYCISCIQGIVSLSLALWAVWRASRPVVYNVSVQEVQPIDPALLAALTNVPRRASAPAAAVALPGAPVRSAAVSVGSLDYRYGVVQGRPVAQTDDGALFVGDETCYGSIRAIWPQRIVLDSGCWLDRSSRNKISPEVMLNES